MRTREATREGSPEGANLPHLPVGDRSLKVYPIVNDVYLRIKSLRSNCIPLFVEFNIVARLSHDLAYLVIDHLYLLILKLHVEGPPGRRNTR